ncbi:hypothetical protein PROP_03139 [Propionicimonas sp. T2.31MG-18]|uniref:hypothetical protein n=1 Tax=Propionicimonas sp. T2.31MG-18 TaxID=3157620 RepID=UPI0035E7CB7F
MSQTVDTATRLPADAVLLTGAAVTRTLEAVRFAQQYRRQIGLSPSVAWARLEIVLGEGVAERGQTDSPNSPIQDAGFVDIATAAQMLECSERTARRLAPRLGGRKQAGVWLVDSTAIREHIAGAIAA